MTGMNAFWWIVMLAANFLMIMFCFRKWGRTGLFVWTAISCMIANIQVTKNVSVFGLEATLGNIVYATGFLATDILSEFYGKDSAFKAVKVGLFSLVSMTVLMYLSLRFAPSESDMAHQSLVTIFSVMPRIALGSLFAYWLSNLHDVWAYDYWKRKTGESRLWLRNNASTIVSQTIDSLVFTFIAFFGIYPFGTLMEIVLTTLVLKWIVALMDTFMIYLARSWVRKGFIEDLAKPVQG